ncbi:21943_t:CDS:2, partial [Racocetra persica]
QFWANAKVLAKVLSSAKNAIKIVESKATITADIFLFLVQIATAINVFKKNDLPERIEFRKQCSEFEQVMENYANIVEFDDDIENLNIEEMLNFNVFLDQKINEKTNNLELENDVYDYDIKAVINIFKEA